MPDGNFDWLVRAKQQGVAPAGVSSASPSLEVEMWHDYRARLLAELAQVEQILSQAVGRVTASAGK
jgi:hypothetical protein